MEISVDLAELSVAAKKPLIDNFPLPQELRM
jgi:hypothetical protein